MKIPVFLTRTTGKVQYSVTKNGPTMLTVAGVAGFAATSILAVRATLKNQKELDRLHSNIKEVHQLEVGVDCTEKVKMRQFGEVYRETGFSLVRIYGPSVALGTASAACVLAGHGIMLRRQAGLVAAYSALDTAYKAYRARVAEEFGQEKELELYSKVKTADGSWKSCNEALDRDETDILPSPYARFFDECSVNWTKTPEYNLLFLRSQQQWANDRLHAHGFIFLNEVYEALGLARSQAGQLVGWKLNNGGDGFVDFGLYQIGDDSNRAFINGLERTVLLDFNVDGVIRIGTS